MLHILQLICLADLCNVPAEVTLNSAQTGRVVVPGGPGDETTVAVGSITSDLSPLTGSMPGGLVGDG